MMNQKRAKQFRYLFNDRQSYRRFKKAYSSAPLSKRLDTIAMAEKIHAAGPIKHLEIPNGR